MTMDPLQWFQQNVINKMPKGGATPKPGGALVPTGGGQLLNPKGIQQITTNLRVPGGGAVPGGGIGMLGARGQNLGLLDGPVDMLGRLILRQDAFIPPKETKEDNKKVEPVATTTGLDTGTGNRAKLDPNAKDLPGVMYVSNFKDGQTDMNAMQDYFKGQNNGENLAKWAMANPALAYKEYSKAKSKEKAADMVAYEEDYGSPMNQQSEQVFEQGKPDVITTSQFDVLNSPTELSAPGKAAYDLAMANPNFIGQRDIPAADNTQEFLTTQMKKFGLVK